MKNVGLGVLSLSEQILFYGLFSWSRDDFMRKPY